MKLYDYINILSDKYVTIVKDGNADELDVKKVKKEYADSNIKKICTDYSPSGDESISTFVYLE